MTQARQLGIIGNHARVDETLEAVRPVEASTVTQTIYRRLLRQTF